MINLNDFKDLKMTLMKGPDLAREPIVDAARGGFGIDLAAPKPVKATPRGGGEASREGGKIPNYVRIPKCLWRDDPGRDWTPRFSAEEPAIP